jgi:PTH1 family peptidyl-tRNA hydrolase
MLDPAIESDADAPTTDWLLFGLGNPGSRYRGTRHNLGWMLIDLLVHRHRRQLIAGRADYFSARIEIEGRRLHLIKPTTYMNLSGRAVRAYLAIEKPEQPEICVAIDDVALDLGRLKLRPKGSSGGHNGLRSVDEHMRSQAYARLRMGCGPVPEGADLSDYVLDDFVEEERESVEALVAKAADAVENWVLKGVQSTMGKFNG